MRVSPIKSFNEPFLDPTRNVTVSVEIIDHALLERIGIDFFLSYVLVKPHHMIDIALFGQVAEMTGEIAIVSSREELSANGTLGQ